MLEGSCPKVLKFCGKFFTKNHKKGQQSISAVSLIIHELEPPTLQSKTYSDSWSLLYVMNTLGCVPCEILMAVTTKIAVV